MARRYHINPKTGTPSQCRALSRCPFGEVEDHYATLEEAQGAYETMQSKSHLEGKKKLVISDVDGTLLNTSLVLYNAVELHREGKIDVGDLADRWEADKKNEELITALAIKYVSELKDKDVTLIEANSTVRTLLSERKNFYSTLRRLVKLKQEGYDVVLITGSPDYLVKPFAEKFGFNFVASIYHKEAGKFTGDITLMAGSNAKVAAIAKLDLQQYDEVIGMGDTASDVPILQVSDHTVLVDPTQETLAALRQKGIVPDEIIDS